MLTTITDIDRDAIQSILDDWISGIEQEDLNLISQIVAPDKDAIYIGASGEVGLRGRDALQAALEAQAAAIKDIQINATDITVHPLQGGESAYATSRWEFNGKMGDQALSLVVRCTWILEKRPGGWMLVHFHKSVGMPG